MGNNVFLACTSLEGINVSADNANYMSEDGVLFDKDKYWLYEYPAGKKINHTN